MSRWKATMGSERGSRETARSNLTMTVSLEAIFLALFVLASQNRLARRPTNAVIRLAD